jgi:hypothetical protein
VTVAAGWLDVVLPVVPVVLLVFVDGICEKMMPSTSRKAITPAATAVIACPSVIPRRFCGKAGGGRASSYL